MSIQGRRVFNSGLVKPSHYDDDGYLIQWVRSAIPANSLAAIYGLALDCAERKILGEQVDVVISAIDETNTRVRPEQIIRKIKAGGGAAWPAWWEFKAISSPAPWISPGRCAPRE